MGSGSSRSNSADKPQNREGIVSDVDEDEFFSRHPSKSGATTPSKSPSYYENRHGRRGVSPPPLSIRSVGASISGLTTRENSRPNSAELKLKNMRQKWATETSKRIHVVVRVRPLNFREIKENAKDIVYMDEINNECTILMPKPSKMIQQNGGSSHKSITFSYDRCYNANATTSQLYNEIPYSLVQGVLEGYNATILAYGQTGSGKSFTMQEDPEHIGIIPRAIVHIFDGKEADEDKDTVYFVHVSYVEIYNEEIRDLLGDNPTRKLDIKGNNGAIQDLTMHHVQTVGHCAELLRKGIANRVTSATTMNAHSSRSHAIFTVWLKIQTRDPSGSTQQTKAKLNLVDLAGSERHGKTGISTNSGHAFKESKSINLSLSTLGKVIQALSVENPGHVPYRESKLTRLFQDSLGGNARTMMIACLSPSDSNYEETVSTLKYAHNTKFINNKPVVNIDKDPKDALIRDLQYEIRALRNRLDH
ncbi:hypothetical protein TCAL_05689 [Tigriopus californicus]|uniref:Kinesin-like protein n=1 Tax=Tigriopus californicus TaxID=6832 RepID=A0A553N6B8_TIGCA|nr:kinesin-like protein KIF17 [Tigriopus californicus]TRY60979.1 hypothetical protein TCAL_05689 [Tigriopus californicus]|eukprot:TCALIF_05689-PA protein Name:"Similar to KIF17 Kinesin-like protein KIF17 (Homo sapiens)" AED:0.10 eAED:0.10 QI:148/0.83/0.71/1/1/1/7/66/475